MLETAIKLSAKRHQASRVNHLWRVPKTGDLISQNHADATRIQIFEPLILLIICICLYLILILTKKRNEEDFKKSQLFNLLLCFTSKYLKTIFACSLGCNSLHNPHLES